MPIIIGRFQNKTDLVPGPDKFTGIHGDFTEARDQLYFFSSCQLSLWLWGNQVSQNHTLQN